MCEAAYGRLSSLAGRITYNARMDENPYKAPNDSEGAPSGASFGLWFFRLGTAVAVLLPIVLICRISNPRGVFSDHPAPGLLTLWVRVMVIAAVVSLALATLGTCTALVAWIAAKAIGSNR
jgi:hypothetical protein